MADNEPQKRDTLPVEPPEPHANGHAQPPEQEGYQPPDRVPGLEDIAVADIGARSDMVREMMTGSEQPAEFLARTRYSLRDIDLKCRIEAKKNRNVFGNSRQTRIQWIRDTCLISLDGESRREAVAMITGNPQTPGRAVPQQRRALIKRFRDMNNQELER